MWVTVQQGDGTPRSWPSTRPSGRARRGRDRLPWRWSFSACRRSATRPRRDPRASPGLPPPPIARSPTLKSSPSRVTRPVPWSHSSPGTGSTCCSTPRTWHPTFRLAIRHPGRRTNLQVRECDPRGQPAGRALGYPTIDQRGNLYFISPRSYSQTLSTVYTGHFTSGQVTGVHLVSGVSSPTRGIVDFDVEVSADGGRLYVSAGDFSSGSGSTSSILSLFDRVGNRFVADPHSARILNEVNRAGMLTYAASVSTSDWRSSSPR